MRAALEAVGVPLGPQPVEVDVEPLSAAHRERLRALARVAVLQVPGVERTETFMILKMYKLSYRWGEAEPRR